LTVRPDDYAAAVISIKDSIRQLENRFLERKYDDAINIVIDVQTEVSQLLLWLGRHYDGEFSHVRRTPEGNPAID
jgi:hypothetical protein